MDTHTRPLAIEMLILMLPILCAVGVCLLFLRATAECDPCVIEYPRRI